MCKAVLPYWFFSKTLAPFLISASTILSRTLASAVLEPQMLITSWPHACLRCSSVASCPGASGDAVAPGGGGTNEAAHGCSSMCTRGSTSLVGGGLGGISSEKELRG